VLTKKKQPNMTQT